ncbi:MAG: hypothetical protein PVG84_04655, partial [Desulfobacterales bacterium]
MEDRCQIFFAQSTYSILSTNQPYTPAIPLILLHISLSNALLYALCPLLYAIIARNPYDHTIPDTGAASGG